MPDSLRLTDVPGKDVRPWTRLRLRVPREDRRLYTVPSLDQGQRIARENQQQLAVASLDVQGRSLQRLREWARRDVLAAAAAYTEQWTGDAGLLPEQVSTLYVGGHQPALYHCGVWAKSFALGRLVAETGAGAVGLNLVVDNDTLGSTAIRVPAGSRLQPRIERIPFDDPRAVQPWEGARILNPQLFESFSARVAEAMSHWNISPVLTEFWPAALAHREQSSRLADCLTAARNQLERRWGVRNLELPISRLCGLDPFLWFASHILVHLPRFREIHNETLHEYREINRVRSRSHPVPDLVERDGWNEAPFWIWRTGDERRSRLFARQAGRELLLSDGHETIARLPLTPEGEACCAVEVLRNLEPQGIHLRTRALTTTLFSRICFADLFLHGIGGAKYDEMTNRIIERFFGLPAPGFLTVSATLLLPLDPFDVDDSAEAMLRQRIRDLELNPERFLDEQRVPEAAPLLHELRRLLAAGERELQQRAENLGGHGPLTDPGEQRRAERLARYELHSRIHEVKQQLARFTAAERAAAIEERERIQQQLQANQVLKDREFSFVLYPVEKLQPFMQQILG